MDAAERVGRDGYAVLERAIEPALVAELVAAIDRRMTELAVPARDAATGHEAVRTHPAPFPPRRPSRRPKLGARARP